MIVFFFFLLLCYVDSCFKEFAVKPCTKIGVLFYLLFDF
uniref:Uncharacterized protein n=1 Tax=Rhizophora mucronata TaxID=61149 RepID=A0A2P2J6X3_RHIMU